MFSIVVVVIMLVMVVKRKAACKQKRDVIVNDNPYCNNTVVALQEQEMQGVSADYNDAHSINQDEDEDEDEDEYFDFGYNSYEVVNRMVHSENTMTPNVFSTLASATKVDDAHAVVVKNKKNGAKKKTEDEPTVVNREDLYAMPMAKAVKMTDKGGGVVVSSGVEEGELYDDATKTNSITR